MVAIRNVLRRSAKVRYGLLGAAAVMAAAQFASAGTFTWITASGTNLDWTSSANWDVNGVPSSTVGDIVNVNANNTGNETINLNSAVTLGILNIGDADASNTYTIQAGTGGTLTFDNGGAGAQINESSTSGGDTISAPITVADAAGLTINNASTHTLTLSGIVSGSGNITYSGTGNLAINGVNTFTGNLNINQGTVSSSSNTTPFGGTAISAGTITLGDGLADGNSATLSYSGTSLTVSNPITVNAGSTGFLTITSSTTNTFTGNVALNNNLMVENTTHADTTTFSGAWTENSSALTLTLEAGIGEVTISGPVTLGSGGLTIADLATVSYPFTFSGGISGTGNLTLQENASASSSQIVISNVAINNTGTITNSGTGNEGPNISGGIGSNVTAVIEDSTTSALTVSGALTVNSGGTTLTNIAGTKVMTLSGGVTGTGNLILDNNSGTASGITLSGTPIINNSGAITNSGTGAGNTLISAVIGTNVTGVTENSESSTLTLQGANTFTSNLNINLGTVSGSNATTPFGVGTIIVGDGLADGNSATLLYTGTGTAVGNPITVNAGFAGILTIEGSTTNAFTSNVALNNNLTVDNTGTGGTTTTFSGAWTEIDGSALTLTKGTGAGIVTISGPVTLGSGGLTIADLQTNVYTFTFSGGIGGTGNLTLDVTNNSGNIILSSLVNNTGTITNSGAGAQTPNISGGIGSNVTGVIENSTASALTISGGLTVNSGGTTLTNSNASGSKVLTVSGGVSGTGNLVLDNDSSILSGITFSTNPINNTGTITNSGTGNGSETISVAIGANVTGVIQNSATSALILSSAANAFSGGLTITSGTVQDGNANSGVLGSGNVTFGTAAAETLNLNNFSPTVGLLAGGSSSFGIITNTATGTATLSLTGSGSQVFAGIIKNGSSTEKVALTLNSGTQTLTGTNTYTGGTTVAGGRLIAGSASALGNGSVTVNGGGTLELDPAVNLGTGNFSLTSGTVQFDLATDATAELTGTGEFTLGAGTSIDLGGGPANYLATYTLLDFTGTGSSDPTVAITDYDNIDWTAALAVGPDGSGGTDAVLSFTPNASVPEPASLMLLGLGAVGLLARRRRA